MQLTKWDPLREMEELFDRVGKSFNWPFDRNRESVTQTGWAPRVDVIENENAFTIKAEIPEVKKEDVKVTAEGGHLTIQGERKQEKEEKNKKFHRVERNYGSFTRSFTLPSNVDPQKIEATFNEGVLSLMIPKNEKSKPKEIEITVK